ncbi:MAG: hypothetical protein PVF57_12395 [Pseudomonadales bacterium]
MKYIDEERLEAISTDAFRNASPYPWLNPEGLLTDAGHRALVAHAPDVSLFRGAFGRTRRYGQASHDRYVLDYEPDLPIDRCWHDFVAELDCAPYRDFVSRLFGVGSFNTRLHWHYTPDGCSVSPHCDADRKLGSHIFYLNTNDDWQTGWGGQTLILDDGGRFGHRSAPAFQDFDQRIPARSIGNHSLLFARVGHSWHGVEPIACPPDRYRKAFIVVFERAGGWLGAVRGLVASGGAV